MVRTLMELRDGQARALKLTREVTNTRDVQDTKTQVQPFTRTCATEDQKTTSLQATEPSISLEESTALDCIL